MGGATDGPAIPKFLAAKPIDELYGCDLSDIQYGGSSYLRRVLESAKEAGNERLIGVVAAFAYTNSLGTTSDRGYLRLAQELFPDLAPPSFEPTEQ